MANYLFKGKVLYTNTDSELYFSRCQKVYKYSPISKKYKPIVKLPASPLRRFSSLFRLSSRLLRNEVRAFIEINNNEYCAVNRENIFYINNGKPFASNFVDVGTKVEPPINLCKGPNNEMLFGEYFNNPNKRSVRIFKSINGGKDFDKVFEFAPGEIRHIHHIIFDSYQNKYWVLVGDHDTEPGLVLANETFTEFEWVRRGEQKFRAVQAFVLMNELVYSMDTEMENNFIMRVSKQDKSSRSVQEVDGSCLHATKCGEYYVISTSIEPLMNPGDTKPTSSSIWVSKDLENWKCVESFSKDRWNAIYFQFGLVVLPQGTSKETILYYSGQALNGIDNRIYSLQLNKS